MKRQYRRYFLKFIAACVLVLWIIMFGLLYVPWQCHTAAVVIFADARYTDYLKLLFVTLCGLLFIRAVCKIIIRMIILKD